MNRKVPIFLASLAVIAIKADEDEDTLKCIVQYLKTQKISEDFFSTVGDNFESPVNCSDTIQRKLDAAYKKYENEFQSDKSVQPDCVMRELRKDESKTIILHREAIKINGIGVKVWNYFKQKEILDDMKKKIVDSIKEKCKA